MSAILKKLDEIGASADCSCGEGCCGPSETDSRSLARPSSGSAPWITGSVPTPAGDVPVAADTLTRRDRLGTWKARWGVGRMSYTVPPGLYAVGRPDPWSPVLVTANYKMSFDHVRAGLRRPVGLDPGPRHARDQRLVRRREGDLRDGRAHRPGRGERLDQVVTHRTLIFPQLGAPGVAAHVVVKGSGFRVVYGPVRAADIPAFLDAGLKATPEMRRVRFDFRDRIVLAPIELVGILTSKYFLAVAGLWIAGLLGVRFLRFDMFAVFGAVVAGSVLVPAFLPWIPGRAFAFKGAVLGLVWAAAVCLIRGVPAASAASWASALSYVLFLPALSAFLAMNFTGSSTFTSLSGVVREMRAAVPLMIGAAIAGLGAMIAGAFLPRI